MSIIGVFSLFTYLLLLKHVFYTIYKICKHRLYRITLIAPVYELFDDPSCSTPTYKLRYLKPGSVSIQRKNVDQTPKNIKLNWYVLQ